MFFLDKIGGCLGINDWINEGELAFLLLSLAKCVMVFPTVGGQGAGIRYPASTEWMLERMLGILRMGILRMLGERYDFLTD